MTKSVIVTTRAFLIFQGAQEPKRATTTLGAFKLREEKKETGLGSWFAKKKSEDSGYVTYKLGRRNF